MNSLSGRRPWAYSKSRSNHVAYSAVQTDTTYGPTRKRSTGATVAKIVFILDKRKFRKNWFRIPRLLLLR